MKQEPGNNAPYAFFAFVLLLVAIMTIEGVALMLWNIWMK